MRAPLLECAICGCPASLWRNVAGHDFTDCPSCGSIALGKVGMEALTTASREYGAAYWAEEEAAAKERSWGGSVARVAETILYCRRPIRRFLDVGTGPGFLLDAMAAYLPGAADRFFGVERFPPARRSTHPGYIEGDLADAPGKFDAGICVEVVEHLTPAMLDCLARSLAAKSNPQALYFFNTSLAPYVRERDPAYMDPARRGHIVAWSIDALARVFGRHGFRVWPTTKPWAFVVEFQSQDDTPIQDRIWAPHPANRAMLNDPTMGEVLYVLALDTARAYG